MFIDPRHRPPTLHPTQHILHPQPLKPHMTLHARPRRMAQQLRVAHPPQLGIHDRFIIMDIQAHGAEMAGFQGGDERVLVDEFAACDVYEAGAGFHCGDGGGGEDFRAAEGGGDEDAVGGGEEGG